MLDGADRRRPRRGEEGEPRDDVDPHDQPDEAAQGLRGHVLPDPAQVPVAHQLEHLEAHGPEDGTGQQLPDTEGVARHPLEHPEEDQGVPGQRQPDRHGAGEQEEARVPVQTQQVQHPGRRGGGPGGQRDAQRSGGPQPEQRAEVLDPVTEEVRRVGATAPDDVHADPELVHRAEPDEQEADQADQAEGAGAVDRPVDLVGELTAGVAGHGLAEAGQQLVLQQRVPAQHEAGDRGHQQHDREQRQEDVVGDAGGQHVALRPVVVPAGVHQVVQPRTAVALAPQQPPGRADDAADRVAHRAGSERRSAPARGREGVGRISAGCR